MTEDEYREAVDEYLAGLTTWDAVVRAAIVVNAVFDAHRKRVLAEESASEKP